MTKTHTETTLKNGLKVMLKEIHTAPLISAWMWYRVGSKDERTGQTGISHWVEHMQFKGTPTFPASVLDKAISRDGGQWNAFTWLDWTTFMETMPADKIDLGLRLEADRMVNSLFDGQGSGVRADGHPLGAGGQRERAALPAWRSHAAGGLPGASLPP